MHYSLNACPCLWFLFKYFPQLFLLFQNEPQMGPKSEHEKKVQVVKYLESELVSSRMGSAVVRWPGDPRWHNEKLDKEGNLKQRIVKTLQTTTQQNLIKLAATRQASGKFAGAISISLC